MSDEMDLAPMILKLARKKLAARKEGEYPANMPQPKDKNYQTLGDVHEDQPKSPSLEEDYSMPDEYDHDSLRRLAKKRAARKIQSEDELATE